MLPSKISKETIQALSKLYPRLKQAQAKLFFKSIESKLKPRLKQAQAKLFSNP